ncbi:hypothetical protein [Pasteurella multocida]|uniref:hypothetical protein n=1 Tax=Pasteurella multocida TaxID=747 RepID=UPI00351AB7D3
MPTSSHSKLWATLGGFLLLISNKTLSYGSKPRFDTIMKITQALGIKLVPMHI